MDSAWAIALSSLTSTLYFWAASSKYASRSVAEEAETLAETDWASEDGTLKAAVSVLWVLLTVAALAAGKKYKTAETKKKEDYDALHNTSTAIACWVRCAAAKTSRKESTATSICTSRVCGPVLTVSVLFTSLIYGKIITLMPIS